MISVIKTMSGGYNVIGTADGVFVVQGHLTEAQLKELLKAGREALKS